MAPGHQFTHEQFCESLLKIPAALSGCAWDPSVHCHEVNPLDGADIPMNRQNLKWFPEVSLSCLMFMSILSTLNTLESPCSKAVR